LAGLGGASLAGFTVASASDEEPRATESRNEVVGPGFLPAAGWDVVQTGATMPPQVPTATAANVPLDSRDPAGELPTTTLADLPDRGVVLFAAFYPAGNRRPWTTGSRIDPSRSNSWMPGREGSKVNPET
jgi:hypothetical protein